MRTAAEIYAAYPILPILETHQLRVAAVGKMIGDSFDGPINTHDVLVTCLFHDMGNIIKSDLDTFPGLFDSQEERIHWEGVKQDYIKRYGANEHQANLAIAREIGLSGEVRQYMDGISFSAVIAIRDGSSYEQKICEYADLRVGPFAVLSLDGRIQDIQDRYRGRQHVEVPEDAHSFNELRDAAFDMERQIFARTAIRPEDINDASVAPLVEALRGYPVLQ